MRNLYNCDFCMFQDRCIAELPDSNGRCMYFYVPAEKSALYSEFVADSFTEDFLNDYVFFEGFGSDHCKIRRHIQERLPVLLDKYHMFIMEFSHADEEVSSDGQ